MQLTELLEQAKKQLAAITGLKPVTVTGVHRDDEGWHVGIEMLEFSRVLPISDILGEYETLLSLEGELLRFERKRTRLRGAAWEAESS